MLLDVDITALVTRPGRFQHLGDQSIPQPRAGPAIQQITGVGRERQSMALRRQYL